MGKPINSKHSKRDCRYFQVYEEWFESPAYRSFNPTARCLLDEFCNIYRPGRNGSLVLSNEVAAKRLNLSVETTRKAFHDLMETGFLVPNEDAQYLNGRAREFRLTIFPSNNGREPTDDWKLWSLDNPVMRFKRRKK